MKNDILFKKTKIKNHTLNSIEFRNSSFTISEIVFGMIANLTPTTLVGRKRLQEWKRKIAIQINSKRKSVQNPDNIYAITIGMKFHPLTHGNQKLDLDNFSKPIIDAVAAGLFCNDNEDLSTLTTYNQFDDSNFQHIYLEKLSDASSSQGELIIILVSQKIS
ncbi:MAG: RusA family crossover junction endodeoxyribonuclease [Thaumarchaeota archaeon]|nr:RusA family crossover junction endodeoxyribonuclease [Nitrososphaerota archaeon]